MAIVNAARILLGEEADSAAFHAVRQYAKPMPSLKSLGGILRTIGLRLGVKEEAQNALRDGRILKTRKAPFQLFGNLCMGIWVLWLKDKQRMDHAISIDCRRKLILDSA